MKKIGIVALLLSILPGAGLAHCPLCTAGAGAVAAGAAYLGVAKPVLGLLIGALGVSMGLWMAKKIPEQYVPRQKDGVALASFLLTVVPILPIIGSKEALYIGIAGEYGSVLNTTYSYDASLVASIAGGLFVLVSPRISSRITEFRGEHIDYQGIVVTLTSLVLMGVLIQAVYMI
jgi:hypothetical protein